NNWLPSGHSTCCDERFSRNDGFPAVSSDRRLPKPSIIAYVHGCAHLHMVVKQFRPVIGFTDAAMRGGVARQNTDVHSYTFAGEAKEPFHGRAGEVRSAR